MLALAGAMQSAMAADMAVKAPIYKAPPVVDYDPWTGFYIGANVGYSWSKWDSTSLAAIFPTGAGFTTAASPSVNGWLGGFQAGYNWRVNRTWLVGLEGDIQISGERASSDGVATSARIPEFGFDFNDIFTTRVSNSWKFPWFGTLRGRIGALVDPETMLYATGGLAVGEFKMSSSASVTCQQFGPGSTGTIPTGNPCIPAAGTPALGAVAFSESTTRAGGAVGAGIEKKFNRNWSGKLEYLYLDFGTRTFFSGTGTATSVRLRDNIVRVGINYAFDSAVVAKY
jgi:outer membrane immunogenic protein